MKLSSMRDASSPASLPNAGLNTDVIHSAENPEGHEDRPNSGEGTVDKLKGALNKEDLKEMTSYEVANSTEAQSNEIINISPSVKKVVNSGEEK